jgi:thiamine biosynthesis protein ThiS
MRELLDHLKLPAKKIAIERNREIVSKSTYDSVSLNDGDIIEIIHFIGGG